MSEPKRILVIEDNETNLMIFTDILTAAGHEVLGAATAEDGLQLARNRQPHLVLMDIQLPGIDGLEAVRCFRRDPAIQSIPIVALTAHAMAGDRDRAMEIGCAGYITKPIRSREFREQIQTYLAQGVAPQTEPKGSHGEPADPCR